MHANVGAETAGELSGRRLLFQWIIATAVGMTLALVVATWPRGATENTPWGILQLNSPVLLFGLLLSLPQWLVLRRSARAGHWVGVTTVSMVAAWVVALTFGALFYEPLGRVWVVIAATLPAGALVGLGQAFVVAPPGHRWAWVAASAVGVSAAWAVIGAVQAIARTSLSNPSVALAGGVLGGAAYGAITGAALIWLRRRADNQSGESA